MAGFSHPLYLLLLLGLPILWYWYHKAVAEKKRKAVIFSSHPFLHEAQHTDLKKREKLLFLVFLLILGCVVVGAADPHIPLVSASENVNLVVALDVSASMSASDYSPTRVEAAKGSSEILIRSLSESDTAGVVIFESGASSAAYLSSDKNRVVSRLEQVSVKTGKTALGDGLALAVDMVTAIPAGTYIVVLLSDGVSNSGMITPQEAAEYAKNSGVVVYTIGVGSESPVEVSSDGVQQYASLDEETLRSIAEITGGEYFRSVDEKTLVQIQNTIQTSIIREPVETSIQSWFFWPILLLLLLEGYLRYGGRRVIP
ncbi:von Willebrand factor, type A [Methanocorpusculum labreanum Z]|uniref:von Willebrand factor, type A n=1 Tax=Methanocorpusculum labreanum (strain ATCC 43576 / DSM 4855 / Z) TaxID=410358 RepID=A2SQ24_METLZ|nr:VWA domain-containing protein [Methanocorpusculum labreanum]ABN06430.1 von Willebrand factor, type A [Methanocorpusculum labreanum Z]